MQNMMPQLNLSSRTIPNAQAAQSAGKTGKSSQKDRFRDLLQNSPGKNSLNDKASENCAPEDQVSKSESVGKTEEQNLSEKPEKTKGKTEENVKEDSTPAEETLLDAGVQMFQYMLDSNPVSLQMVTDTDMLTEDMMAEDMMAEDMMAVPQVFETMISVSEENGDMGMQVISQEGILPGQENAKEAATVTESFADMMSEVKAAANIVSPEERISRTAVRQSEETIVKMEMPEDSGEIQAAVIQGESSAYQESGQPAEDGREAMEDTGSLIHSVGNPIQQNPQQNPIQQMTGTQQTVHIRADHTQELMNQLMEQLRSRVFAGNQEFEIQLHPENLGRLAIKVAYAAEKVSISIVCSNEKTMEVLSAGAKNIAQIMEENLGTPTTVVVDQQEENYLEQYKNQQNSQHQQKEEKKEKEHAPEDNQDFLQQLRLGLI